MTRTFGWRIGLWIGVVLMSGSGSGLAQAPVTGLSGVQGGGQGGVFTIPRVDAHGRGIPGVTRPMLMAGPVGGGGGAGLGNAGAGGGGGAGMMVNPNWVGAAAMFMPQLLTGNPGNGANAAGGSAQNPVGNRVVGGFGGAAPRTPSPVAVPGTPVAVEARRTVASAPVPVRPVPPALDPALADARLLAHQREQAGQGSPSAQLALARRYATGNGVEANAAVARVWLEEAARSGSEEAKAELGDGKARNGS